MSIRTLIVMFLALVCGVSAAIGSRYLLKPIVKDPETTPILVATVEIARGQPFRPEFVKMQQWPKALVPPGAILDIKQVEGHVAKSALVPGEPLMESRMLAGSFGAASLVKPGWRAFTIATPTTASGVAGFVLPGNRVDVLLTMTDGVDEKIGGTATWTLLQNVEILAADTRLDNDGKKQSGKLPSVTLLVTPEMATKLTLAANMGSLTLTLRNDADVAIAETSPVTGRDIRFLQEAMLADLETEKEDDVPSDPVQPVVLAGAESPKQESAQIKTYRGSANTLVLINRR